MIIIDSSDPDATEINNNLVLTFFICFMVFGADSFASEKDSVKLATNEQLAKVQVKRLSRELSLTRAQSKKVHIIMVKRAQNMKLAHKTNRLSEDQIKKINRKAMIQLAKVLSPNQRAKYKKLNAELYRQKNAYRARRMKPEVTVEDRMLDLQ